MITITGLRTYQENKKLVAVMLGISIFGVSFVSWFTYTELFVIKAVCTWCAISAINMIIIFILTMRSYFLLRKKNHEKLLHVARE